MSLCNESARGVFAPGFRAPKDSRKDSHDERLLTEAFVRPVVGHQTLQSTSAIQSILHRECARCERSGSVFCLVVFQPREGESANKTLGGLLLEEVRLTDEVGFLDEHQLCAFLPYTVPAGAERFMARIDQSARAIGLEPAGKLYVYPSQTAHPITTRKTRQRRDDDGPHAGGGNGHHKPAAVEELLIRHSPWWKRLIDVVVAFAALLFLSPLLLFIALAIKVSSDGPVFFIQWRSGLGGKPFQIFKFRTMVPDADHRKRELLSRNEQDGPAFKMARDPRITRIGRLLRATSLDELPQFINVLLGDMSLVGPRPLPIDESQACDTWHRRRLDVVPGITCTWQIKGRGTVSFAEWIRMDRDYVQRRSLIHDVKLLVLTLPAVLSRRGAK